ncbi:MAG: TIGR00282 family metallophosphoesterase [Chrysiogenetes bacterium]|nr:TIGR00282 family metallophosphoesterase [Chrysiogenetes bacterium]
MKLLFVGDIVGKPGRRALRDLLPGVIRDRQVDITVVNCENASSGHGLTREHYHELLDSGADLLTSGNHIWDMKEIFDYIDGAELLLRPINYPDVPGRGTAIVQSPGGTKLGVANVMGTVFMGISLESPWKAIDAAVEELRQETNCILVDVHAEASSEKQAMGHYLDGRVSFVVGTHTHVQTADERVLPGGTAYLTDAGMTGPYDSVIGMKKEASLRRFLTGMPSRYECAKNDVRLCGAIVDIDEETGKARGIERINIPLPA